MTPLPGHPLDLPLPPECDRAFGYPHDARFVALRWDYDHFGYDDGHASGSGHPWTFLAYARHPAVAPLLAGIDLGGADHPAPNVLLLDREANRVCVVPAAEAREFLQGQWPPLTPLTPEQMAEVDRLVSLGWREEAVDADHLRRAMDVQRGRVGRMVGFLDMCPVPGERGRS